MSRARIVFAAFIFCGIGLYDAETHAQAVDWKVGRDLRQQLDTTTSVTWSSALRPALMNLSRSQRVAVMLDRRVDPGQTIQFAAKPDSTLEQLFRDLAERLDLGFSEVGAVVYIGPRATADRLATVAEMKKEGVNASPARSRLIGLQPIGWESLATPRELIEQLATQMRLTVVGLDRVPHDLWPAVDLPPLTFAERMTLLLAGFDLTFTLENTTLTIEPMPPNPTVERSLPAARRATPKLVAQIAERFPQVAIRSTGGGGARVTGRVEDIEAIDALLSGKPVRRPSVQPAAEDDKRYSLKIVKQPVGGIAKALAGKLKMEIRFDAAIESKLGTLISFDVKEVNRDGLLAAVLGPAGLTFEIRDNAIVVSGQ